MRVSLIAPPPGPRTGSRTYAEKIIEVLSDRHEVTVVDEPAGVSEDADLLHVLDAKSVLGSVPRLTALNLPLVADLHDDYWTGRPPYPAFDRPARALLWQRQRPRFLALLQRADAVVVHAGHMHDAVPHDRTVTVPIAVAPASDTFRPGPRTGSTQVLFAGRDALRKGLPVLGGALRILRAEGMDLRARVAGGDWLHLRAAARWWMRGVPTRFLGDLDGEAMIRAYAEADLLAAPSYTEAFGLVAQEALVHGLPVVASRVGGLEDILTPSRFDPAYGPEHSGGILVPPGDPRALAGGIREIAANLQGWKERAKEAGRIQTTIFTPRAALDTLDRAYRIAVKHREEMS